MFRDTTGKSSLTPLLLSNTVAVYVMEMGFSNKNIGPRIIEITDGKQRLVMDVDNPATVSQGGIGPLQMHRYQPLKYAGLLGLAFICLGVLALPKLK